MSGRNKSEGGSFVAANLFMVDSLSILEEGWTMWLNFNFRLCDSVKELASL